jgi:hypothetical protein
MTTVACRWPSGLTIAVPRPGAPPLTFKLNGPPGQPATLPPAYRGAPSREAAAMLHKQVVDTVKLMKDTANTELEEWRTTEVPGDVWAAWYAAHADTDAVRDRMVFALN